MRWGQQPRFFRDEVIGTMIRVDPEHESTDEDESEELLEDET